jgi:hypothetical protein
MPALEDADRSSPVLAPEAHSSPLVLRGALALLIGGPLSLVFHVLWKVGHGPTVVNEHGVVLGLTNDRSSYLSAVWTVPVALGVVAVCSLHRGRLSRVAAVLTVLGLARNTVAAFVRELYSIGGLVLNAGVLCLSIMILRGGVLPPCHGFRRLIPGAARGLRGGATPDLFYTFLTTCRRSQGGAETVFAVQRDYTDGGSM